MSTIQELQYKFSADTDGAMNAIRKMNSYMSTHGFKGFTDGMAHLQTNWASTLLGMGAQTVKFAAVTAAALGAAAIGVGVAVAKVAMDFDSLERGLTAVMGSSQAAAAEMLRLREVAKLPGLGLEEAIQGSINLQAAGLSALEARNALQAFGNALATVGKGKAELEGVQTALVQIISKGKVSAEEINQLSERLPQVRQAMIAAFGTADTEVLQKMKLDAKDFVNTLTAEFAKLPPVTSGLQNSFENAMDNMKIAMKDMKAFIGPIVESLSGKFANFFGDISEWAGKNQGKLKEWADKVNQAFDKAVEGTVLFIDGLLGIETPTVNVANTVDRLIDSFNNLGRWWATNGFRMGESIRNAWDDIGAYIVVAAAAMIAFKAAMAGNWLVALVASAAALGTYLGLRIARRNRRPGTPPNFTPIEQGQSPGTPPTVGVREITRPGISGETPEEKAGETLQERLINQILDGIKKARDARANAAKENIQHIQDEMKAERDKMLQQVGFQSVRSLWARGMEAGSKERFSVRGTSMGSAKAKSNELTQLEKQTKSLETIAKIVQKNDRQPVGAVAVFAA